MADPDTPRHVFNWSLTRTEDPFGNRIVYEYERDRDTVGPHHWDQLYLHTIRYADFGPNDARQFLVSVTFIYEERPAPFSGYRAGFENRTRRRCTGIEVRTHAHQDLLARTYDLVYLDQRPELAHLLPLNRASVLSQVVVTGHNEDATEQLPPLEFGYTPFEPEKRNFFPIQGPDLPARSLSREKGVRPLYTLYTLYSRKGDLMSRVEEIQLAIESLSPEEYARLRQWFSERDWEQWDKQIEEDAKSGKLDFLIKEALEEKSQGRLKEL